MRRAGQTLFFSAVRALLTGVHLSFLITLTPMSWERAFWQGIIQNARRRNSKKGKALNTTLLFIALHVISVLPILQYLWLVGQNDDFVGTCGVKLRLMFAFGAK
jgi:hypothetical protein